MNPPRKTYETHRCESAEEVHAWIDSMDLTQQEVTVRLNPSGGWIVDVFVGWT